MLNHIKINHFFTILFFCFLLSSCSFGQKPTIKIGLLYSLSGTMSISEKNVVDAQLLAIEQINQSGGILGRQIEAIVVDGKSDWSVFADQAEKLISQDKISALFACWTSACRKTLKPIIEKHDHLLFYPLQYEGMEASPNIIYTGATPNQQVIPAVHWALENLGQRIYLVGSDYIYPKIANLIVKDLLKKQNITLAGESYIPLGKLNIENTINDIKKSGANVIINTINGDTNKAFFNALQGESSFKVLSFSLAEPEAQEIGVELLAGHYAAWGYFQSLTNETNQHFVSRFKEKYGAHRVLDGAMESAYIAINLWAQAVENSRTEDNKIVKASLSHLSFNAPQGVVTLDDKTHHLWQRIRIGKMLSSGQFDVIWSSDSPIRPAPYPTYYSKKEWQKRIKEAGINE